MLPNLEYDVDVNPTTFILVLLQRLGPAGLANLESAVRGSGSVNGDQFVTFCLRCLSHSTSLPGSCSFPWQRKCYVGANVHFLAQKATLSIPTKRVGG